MDVPVIAGIGEILFDVIGDVEELGGAPINFAYHVNVLGARGYAISTIGNDDRGRRALKELERRNLSTECITVTDKYETGYVQAQVDSNGIASYQFPDDIAWDHLKINQKAFELAKHLDAVCFGSLVQRGEASRREVMEFLSRTPEKTIRVFDLNLRQNFYTENVVVQSLEHADILKLNDEELPVLVKMLGIAGSEKESLGVLVQRFGLRLVSLTRGGKGSLLLDAESFSDHPGIQTEHVEDTIGAGDAFTAATVISLLKGYDLDTVNEKANRVASWVCSQKGAMPVMPESFRL